MNPPAITLLVPCYNAAPFLPRLAEAVRALTVPFAGILCYDDGSTDDTVAVARRLGWTILTPNSNRGVAHTRNRLAAAAATDWIHFHDADDRLAPDFVERLGPLCDAGTDVVSCDADWIGETDGALEIAWRYEAKELRRDPFPYLLTHALGLNNSIIRRSAWDGIGGCDESLAIWEDADVHIRLARSGARWQHVPAVLTWSLRRNESFSHDWRRNWRCRLATLEGYAAHPSAGPVRAILAEETENAASVLAALHDNEAAGRAIALCRRLGRNPPTTCHPALRLLKPFLPATTLLRWQDATRRRPKPARHAQ